MFAFSGKREISCSTHSPAAFDALWTFHAPHIKHATDKQLGDDKAVFFSYASAILHIKFLFFCVYAALVSAEKEIFCFL